MSLILTDIKNMKPADCINHETQPAMFLAIFAKGNAVPLCHSCCDDLCDQVEGLELDVTVTVLTELWTEDPWFQFDPAEQ